MNRTAFEGVVSLRPYHDGAGGGWQAGYRGVYARASTRAAAVAELKRLLAEAGVALPEGRGGSVRLAPTQEADAGCARAAEALPYAAWGPDRAEAVAALRELCAGLGAECPEYVHDVEGAIRAWMN